MMEARATAMQADRLETIRLHLVGVGSARLTEIMSLTGASSATVRRDLAALERQGVAERVHGGARLSGISTTEAAFEQRAGLHLAAKRAIGSKALDFLRADGSYFFDAGTTVLQLARFLSVIRLPVGVVTNGLPIAQALIGVDAISLWLLGGRVRGANASTVGPYAEAMLDRLRFEGLFFGAGAITPNGTICGANEDEAHLNARMIERSSHAILLADSSKFGLRAPHVVGALSEQIHVVTDAGLDGAWRERIVETGAGLTIAPTTPRKDSR